MSNDGNLTESQRNFIEQEKKDEAFKIEAIASIKNNKRFNEFFSKYTPDIANSFIDTFVTIKLTYTKYANFCEEEAERANIGMLPEARVCLNEILQRKLFDAQCLWRAGKLDIDTKHIELVVDFYYWREYIFACPFIDPISEADIDLYMQYLNSSYSDSSNHYFNFQDYDEMKEAIANNEEDGSYPEWYTFYDTYRGTGMNIKLPDVKSSQEDFYRDLYFKEEKRKRVEANLPESTYKQPNFISPYNEQDVKSFISAFYDSQEMELWKNYNDSRFNSMDGLDEAFTLLSEAREQIPIKSHHNWQEAIIEAAKLYRNRLISRALPLAYEEYLMKLNTGISFYDEIKNRQAEDLHEIIRGQIIKGRILNGESPDLNIRD